MKVKDVEFINTNPKDVVREKYGNVCEHCIFKHHGLNMYGQKVNTCFEPIRCIDTFILFHPIGDPEFLIDRKEEEIRDIKNKIRRYRKDQQRGWNRYSKEEIEQDKLKMKEIREEIKAMKAKYFGKQDNEEAEEVEDDGE